jgi:hypothetical protein
MMHNVLELGVEVLDSDDSIHNQIYLHPYSRINSNQLGLNTSNPNTYWSTFLAHSPLSVSPLKFCDGKVGAIFSGTINLKRHQLPCFF